MTSKRPPDQRLDGITKLKGSVTFAADGLVSIDLTVDEGSTTDTSSIKATGARGDTVSSDGGKEVTKSTKTQNNRTVETLAASGLPAAATTDDYTVQVSYLLGNDTTRKKLAGTILKAKVVFGTAVTGVTLT